MKCKIQRDNPLNRSLKAPMLSAMGGWKWSWEKAMDRLGPMTVKELRQGLRRRMFVWPFLLVQALAVLAMVVEFSTGEAAVYTKFSGVLNVLLLIPGSDQFSGPFWGVVGLMCLVLMPMGGLVLMGQEMDEGNYELLLMTPLTRWGVVLGKFYSLWGLCLLTLGSLVPYGIVRYMVGGMDVWRNLAAGLTVVLASGIMCAGALGASAFRSMPARIGVFVAFLGSLALGGSVPLAAAALTRDGCGVWYHVNVLGVVWCYVALGLALARSRIRLVVHQYEIQPSALVIVLLAVTPFISMMSTLFTAAYLGSVGLIFMGLAAWFADQSPKAPSTVAVPPVNTPLAQPPALGR